MTDATLPDLIARLRARKAFGHFLGDVTWFLLDQPDKDCTDAADALAKADERIAELEREEEKIYRAGVDQGYSDAVQAIDRLTGGDGEYLWSTELERHVPDPAAMMARIESRFEEVCVHLKVTAARAETAEAKVADRDTTIKALKDQISSEADAKAKVQAYRVAAEARANALEAKVKVLEGAQGETIKHLDRALWQVTRLGLGNELAGVNWQAVVGMMTGDIERARCAALAQSGEG